jgi:hypothetical protein
MFVRRIGVIRPIANEVANHTVSYTGLKLLTPSDVEIRHVTVSDSISTALLVAIRLQKKRWLRVNATRLPRGPPAERKLRAGIGYTDRTSRLSRVNCLTVVPNVCTDASAEPGHSSFNRVVTLVACSKNSVPLSVISKNSP